MADSAVRRTETKEEISPFEFVKEKPSCEDDQNVDRCNEQDLDTNSQHNDEHVREELRSN